MCNCLRCSRNHKSWTAIQRVLSEYEGQFVQCSDNSRYISKVHFNDPTGLLRQVHDLLILRIFSRSPGLLIHKASFSISLIAYEMKPNQSAEPQVNFFLTGNNWSLPVHTHRMNLPASHLNYCVTSELYILTTPKRLSTSQRVQQRATLQTQGAVTPPT